MAQYRGRLIDSLDGEDAFDFEAADTLMQDTPVRVVRAFFSGADRAQFRVPHEDWELNAAFKSRERGVVTCLGAFHVADQPPAPFVLLIAAKA